MKGRCFTSEEAQLLQEIIRNRRDVRGNRFLRKPIAADVLNTILRAGIEAPSVGYSQPWEFVIVRDRGIREQIKQSYNISNELGADHFSGEKRAQYQSLKLEGILESDLNIAVFYHGSNQPVLGQVTMPEMGRYSVVCAVQNMWLMARSLNVGMGWVSILDPIQVKRILSAPDDRELIAYLCLGYVDEFYQQPELLQRHWALQKSLNSVIVQERY